MASSSPASAPRVGAVDSRRWRRSPCSTSPDHWSSTRSCAATATAKVTSLIISGAFPVLGVLLTIIRGRHLDVIRVLVLTGIAVGVGLGLASHNTKLGAPQGRGANDDLRARPTRLAARPATLDVSLRPREHGGQSAGTALSISKVVPYLVLAILIAWTIVYTKRGQRQAERADAARRAAQAATPD